MRKIVLIIILVPLLALPAAALEISAPEVPESGRQFMPDANSDFGAGLLEVFKGALMYFRPDLKEAAKVCLGVLSSVMIVSVLRTFSGIARKTAEMAGVISISVVLLNAAGSMIHMAAETVTEISEYGKLLLPVMTTALAAQGSAVSSAALYSGTLIANTVLGSLIANALTPLVYLFLALAVAYSATGEQMLKKIQDAAKWFTIWSLKTVLYIFTGYVGITGVISGTTDAAALKAAKLAISGVVPVVGGILSDASEAVLVGAGMVKNAAGIYGMLAAVSVWIGPFLKIGSHYLLLKATAALSGVFGCKEATELIGDYSTALGLLLGMTGAVCLMLIISTVCFMKGVG